MIIYYVAKVHVDSKTTKVTFLTAKTPGVHFTEDKCDPDIRYYSTEKKALEVARLIGSNCCILPKRFKPAY